MTQLQSLEEEDAKNINSSSLEERDSKSDDVQTRNHQLGGRIRLTIAANEEGDDDYDELMNLLSSSSCDDQRKQSDKVTVYDGSEGKKRQSQSRVSKAVDDRNYPNNLAYNPPTSRQSSFIIPKEGEIGEVNDSITAISFARGRTTSSSLDDTAHNLLRGNGYLASRRELGMDLDMFAEGCKFLALIARGELNDVKAWLSDCPDLLEFRDYDRRTALHVAASEGHLTIVQFLVESVFNNKRSVRTKKRLLNRSDRWGGSPLDDAHRHRHTIIAQFLRGHGAGPGTLDNYTHEFMAAASQGDAENIKELIDICGVDVNFQDYDGRSAIHLAAVGNHANVLRILVEVANSNINLADRWGNTPLDDAFQSKSTTAIEVLKQNNATRGNNNLSEKSTSYIGHKIRRVKSDSIDASVRIGHKLEHNNLLIDFSEVEIVERIGGGAFGEIFKCKWRGTLVAAKCIKSAKIHQEWAFKNNGPQASLLDEETRKQAIEDFRLEIDILKQIRHPNICMLLAYSTTSDFEVMISELAKCSLEDLIKANLISNKKIPKATQIVYARQLAQGMNYLHTCKPPIIHRDLKPANLLLDYSGELQIADFGLAKLRPKPSQMESDKYVMTGETGSYRYMAPEVFRYETYNEKVDVYSYAMIVYYIIAGHQPWPTMNGSKAAFTAAVEGNRPNIPSDWDDRIVRFLKLWWDDDPDKRPSFENILMELNDYSQAVFKTEQNAAPHVKNAACCTVS